LEKVDRRQIIRRAAERVALPLKGTAFIEIEGEQHEREIITKDLSVNGVYFLTDLSPRPSDRVSIRLPLVEGEASFEAAGTVVRVEIVSENSFGVAVKFDESPNDD